MTRTLSMKNICCLLFVGDSLKRIRFRPLRKSGFQAIQRLGKQFASKHRSRAQPPANAAHRRRRGNRTAMLFAAAHESICWHDTDMPAQPDDVRFAGVERTCRASGDTSVFDPKRPSHQLGRGVWDVDQSGHGREIPPRAGLQNAPKVKSFPWYVGKSLACLQSM